ncbi:MAG: class I SAM-dependent methyltransferase [Myxococcota bacterium]
MSRLLSRFASRLDSWLFGGPFEGALARRYARVYRPGFGDLDRRLLERWQGELATATTVLDLGSGPGHLACQLGQSCPDATIIAVEPSGDFPGAAGRAHSIRARAEALPLADRSIDVAICLSSIRHIADRGAALGELRRVVAPGGVAFIVELDPRASRQRIRNHSRSLRSLRGRATFGPLCVRLAPDAADIASTARRVGWAQIAITADRDQPVFIMRLAQG